MVANDSIAKKMTYTSSNCLKVALEELVHMREDEVSGGKETLGKDHAPVQSMISLNLHER
jgi:hypothetical protein